MQMLNCMVILLCVALTGIKHNVPATTLAQNKHRPSWSTLTLSKHCGQEYFFISSWLRDNKLCTDINGWEWKISFETDRLLKVS